MMFVRSYFSNRWPRNNDYPSGGIFCELLELTSGSMASLTAKVIYRNKETSFVENIKEVDGAPGRSELIRGVERLKQRLNESLTKLVEQEKASGVQGQNSTNGAGDDDDLSDDEDEDEEEPADKKQKVS